MSSKIQLMHYKGRPLRIMQVHTCYAGFLQSLYKKHTTLAQSSYEAQIQAFIRSGYGAIHFPMPYMFGCETLSVLADNEHMQNAWLKEHGLSTANTAQWQEGVLRLQIKHFQPDILYILDPIRFDGNFLNSLETLPPCILGWRAADIPAQTDWTGFDAMLSGLPKLLALAKTLGAKDGIMFHPGMPSWIAREVSSLPHEVDVVFVGSIKPMQHVRRLAFLEDIAKAANIHGFSLELYLMCDKNLISPIMRPYVRPTVFGLDMHRALRRGRIVLDDRAWHGVVLPNRKKSIDLGGEDTSNMRIFEGTGGGSLVLTEHLQGISRYFEIDKEIVTYKNSAEAVDKALYYLKNSSERERIAKAGQTRCLKDWNMQIAIQKFLEIARNILAKK